MVPFSSLSEWSFLRGWIFSQLSYTALSIVMRYSIVLARIVVYSSRRSWYFPRKKAISKWQVVKYLFIWFGCASSASPKGATIQRPFDNLCWYVVRWLMISFIRIWPYLPLQIGRRTRGLEALFPSWSPTCWQRYWKNRKEQLCPSSAVPPSAHSHSTDSQ